MIVWKENHLENHPMSVYRFIPSFANHHFPIAGGYPTFRPMFHMAKSGKRQRGYWDFLGIPNIWLCMWRFLGSHLCVISPKRAWESAARFGGDPKIGVPHDTPKSSIFMGCSLISHPAMEVQETCDQLRPNGRLSWQRTWWTFADLAAKSGNHHRTMVPTTRQCNCEPSREIYLSIHLSKSNLI